MNGICQMKGICIIFGNTTKGANFEFEMLNFQYSLDIVSNIYVFIKIQIFNFLVCDLVNGMFIGTNLSLTHNRFIELQKTDNLKKRNIFKI